MDKVTNILKFLESKGLTPFIAGLWGEDQNSWDSNNLKMFVDMYSTIYCKQRAHQLTSQVKDDSGSGTIATGSWACFTVESGKLEKSVNSNLETIIVSKCVSKWNQIVNTCTEFNLSFKERYFQPKDLKAASQVATDMSLILFDTLMDNYPKKHFTPAMRQGIRTELTFQINCQAKWLDQLNEYNRQQLVARLEEETCGNFVEVLEARYPLHFIHETENCKVAFYSQVVMEDFVETQRKDCIVLFENYSIYIWTESEEDQQSSAKSVEKVSQILEKLEKSLVEKNSANRESCKAFVKQLIEDTFIQLEFSAIQNATLKPFLKKVEVLSSLTSGREECEKQIVAYLEKVAVEEKLEMMKESRQWLDEKMGEVQKNCMEYARAQDNTRLARLLADLEEAVVTDFSKFLEMSEMGKCHTLELVSMLLTGLKTGREEIEESLGLVPQKCMVKQNKTATVDGNSKISVEEDTDTPHDDEPASKRRKLGSPVASRDSLSLIVQYDSIE